MQHTLFRSHLAVGYAALNRATLVRSQPPELQEVMSNPEEKEVPEWMQNPQPLRLPLAAIARIEELTANPPAPSTRLLEAARRHGWRKSQK